MEPVTCPFCQPEADRIILQDDAGLVLADRYPVVPGHLLIIPRRHIARYFQATTAEKHALWDLVDRAKAHLDAQYSPDGYTIGVNDGEAAGQSVFHLHIHLIPRRNGDVARPRGGVRHVIPGKGNY